MDLSVVVLNWNTKEELSDCLNSLCREALGEVQPDQCEAAVGVGVERVGGMPHQLKPSTGSASARTTPAIEVIVVDNASADGSAEMVAEQHPWAKLIRSERNLGFSAGNNIGIRAATGRYVMLLNPDTLVHPGALRTLVEFADSHPEAGIIGPRLLNADGSIQYSCRSFPTLATGFFRNTFLGRLFPRNRFNRQYLLTDWDHSAVREVDWVSGAAMMIRRQVLDQIGLLDEGFFMYCEDVDICYRAHQAGWKVMYCPDAVITHMIARASDKNAAAMIIERHKSMYRFFRKHYASASSPFVWPVVIVGLVGRASVLVVKNRIDVYRMNRHAARTR
ncbi:MAG: glycosyltransferase family 2 protein [Armatimonadota bacterium]